MFNKTVDSALKSFYKALSDLKEVSERQSLLVNNYDSEIQNISEKKREAVVEKTRAEKVISQIEAIIQ